MMNPLAQQVASNASFQAFMNCYLREIDSGVWHDANTWFLQTGLKFDQGETHVIELQLSEQDTTLAIGVTFRSLVGRHCLTQVYQQQSTLWQWQALDSLSTILLLIKNIYSGQPQLQNHQLELIARIVESHQVMTHYLDQRIDDPRLQAEDFISSEQSILFGHWLHPTPKSRQGIHSWQHQRYTPELCGEFPLHFFAVDRKLIDQGSMLEETAEDIIRQIACHGDGGISQDSLDAFDDANQALLPVHPLQAQWLISQPYVTALMEAGKIVDAGPLGPNFTPTSSVRTLYCENLDYMLKLSIPVKITNSMRVNMQHELKAGLAAGQLLRKCGFSEEFPEFQTIDDPAYITVNLEGMQESGFEVIIRENPFIESNNRQVHSIAALVQEPIEAGTPSRLKQLIESLSQRENRSMEAVSRDWFDAYWACSIASAIRLYDKHGIALEAHQQNSLLDVSNGYPSQYYYRDNQGFYLSTSLQSELLAIEPLLAETSDLFYDDAMICDRFSYYLVINQLFSVINRFALDGLISEQQLLMDTHNKLQQLVPHLPGLGKQLVHAILNRRDIPCKGNLLTRVDDVDELQAELELAVYTKIQNPLHAITRNTPTQSLSTNLEPLVESA